MATGFLGLGRTFLLTAESGWPRRWAFELDDPEVKTDVYHAFERGKDYNISSSCDPVISDLVGLKSRWDDTLEIDPLVPEGEWDWFCLEDVPYQGKQITILYDKDGRKYHRGRGLQVLVDDKPAGGATELRRVLLPLGPAHRPGGER